MLEELVLNRPRLRTAGRLVIQSTDAEPAVDADGGTLEAGTELYVENSGVTKYWTGSAWEPVNAAQIFNQLVDLHREIRDRLKDLVHHG